MDDNKHPNQPQQQKENSKGQAEGAVQAIANRRIFSKRWLYPAIYLGAAALIIGLMYIKSQVGTGHPTAATNGVDEPSSQPAPAAQTFAWPVKDGESYKLGMGYFPVHGTDAEKAKALVHYDNGYYPHTGLDILPTNTAKPLDVTAALDGKVTKVVTNQLSLNGQMVEITSDNGYVTRYESLSKVGVKEGDTVKQGDLIGTSGTSLFEQDQGNHVYFEVLKDGQTIDPTTVLPQR
jgi:stage II sporulation protein Q